MAQRIPAVGQHHHGRGMTGRSGTALLAEVAERAVNGCRSWSCGTW